jgi:hypothetical protein
MSSKPVPKIDPLLAALIDKLPPPKSEFSAAARTKWLAMAAMAFDVAYGAVEDAVELPSFLAAEQPNGTAKAAPAKVAAPINGGFEFYVDKDGYARREPGGLRVEPTEVPSDEMIYDARTGPARNRETIIWADDTTGAQPGMSFCGPG